MAVRKTSRDEADARVDYARAMVEAVQGVIVVVDSRYRVLAANRGFRQLFRVEAGEIEGKFFFGRGAGQCIAPRLRTRLRGVLKGADLVEEYEIDRDFAEIGRRRLAIHAEKIAGTQTILIAIEDATARKHAREEAVQSHAAQIQALAARLMNAQEEERRRVSRELHDQICQQLAALAIDIGAFAETPAPSAPTRKRVLRDLQARIVGASEATRHIAYQLHPSVLDDLGLVASLGSLCREISRKHAIPVDFLHNELPSTVSREAASCLYRVAQESLQNAARHSGAERVSVTIGTDGRNVVLSVIDDGAGFDPEAARGLGGLGLVGMAERTRQVSGKLAVRSSPGRGVRIILEVPLAANRR